MAKQLKPTASTQEHLDIQDVADDLVILKTGWVALVMRTTAVNFDLLSEAEQDATIYAYGAFLNSLSFPVETLIRNKKADITAYFNILEEAEASQPNPDIKRQIQKYQDFLQSIVQQKTVLDKQFYLIINYSPLEGGFKGSFSRQPTQSRAKAQLVEAAKAALAPKRDHIIKQTARLGLSTRQLTTQELIELFYDIYNPAPTGTQRVILDTASYTTPIVEPAIENPSTPLMASPAPAPKEVPSFAEAMEGKEEVGGQQAGNLTGANLRPVPQRPISQESWGDRGSQGMGAVTSPQAAAPASPAQSQALAALQQAAAKAATVVGAPQQDASRQGSAVLVSQSGTAGLGDSMGGQGDKGGGLQ